MLEKIIYSSAGCGKTSFIIENSKNSDLDKTVFLTFSNSAAAEIKSRLLKNKSDIKSFSFFSSFRVYTVHSFCFEILNIFKYEIGFPGESEISAAEGDKIWDILADRFFKRKWDKEFIVDFLNCSSNEDLSKSSEILAKFCKKEDILSFFKDKGREIFFLLELNLTKKSDCQSVNFDEKEALKNLKDYFSFYKDEKKLEYSQNAFKKLEPVLSLGRAALEELICEFGRRIYLPYMYENALFDCDAAVFLAAEILNSYKSDFASFEKKLKEENFYFDKIYVDEAQDCDIAMNAFFSFFFSEKCPIKIILAGDPKQSVYRWRGAYPEEFFKMREEAKDKIFFVSESKRITNKNTADFINNFSDFLKNNIKSFSYDSSKEKLETNKNCENSEINIKYALIKDKETLSEKDLREIFTPASALIFRKRKDLKSTFLDNIKVEKFTYLSKDKFYFYPYQKDFLDSWRFEEYSYLALRPLLWLSEGRNKKETASILFFSPLGFLLSLRLWPEIFKDINIEKFEEWQKIAEKIREKIYFSYQAGIEKNYALKVWRDAEEKSLWDIILFPSPDASCEKTARFINHALACLYDSCENSKKIELSGTYPSQELDRSYAPPDYAAVYESKAEFDKEPKADTMHSSKGLTYDKAVILADFDEMIKTFSQENLDYLFDVSFDKVLTPNQEVKADFFPYLGKIDSKILTSGSQNINKIYNLQKSRAESENACLLYVALTRTRKDLVFLIKTKKEEYNLFLSFLKTQKIDKKISLEQIKTENPQKVKNNFVLAKKEKIKLK